jgi:hypothetical protein
MAFAREDGTRQYQIFVDRVVDFGCAHMVFVHHLNDRGYRRSLAND